jgi:hypothetical protein
MSLKILHPELINKIAAVKMVAATFRLRKSFSHCPDFAGLSPGNGSLGPAATKSKLAELYKGNSSCPLK